MNRLHIGPRMALAFGAVLLLAFLTIALAMWRLQVSASTTQTILEEPLVKERLMADWYRVIFAGVRRVNAIVKSADPSLATFFADDNAEAGRVTAEYQKQMEPLLREEGEKKIYADMMRERKVYLAARDNIVAAKKDGRADEAAKLFEEQFVPTTKVYLGIVASLLEEQRRNIDRAAVEINQRNRESRVLVSSLAVLMLALGALCAWAITRSVVGPIREALAAARRVAQGDLTTPLKARSQDEVGQLINELGRMQRTLSGTIAGIRQSTESISNASAEIATGNQDLSQRTEQAASNLQQTASSMEQLNVTVRQTADSARSANQLAASAATVAQQGGEVVSQVVTTMGEISASSKKISDIIGVIDGIAFQTNILALNAAVEAARAGEQGRGFAVVASEVRSLAQRSANAAKEIKSLIGASVERVESGTKLVADAGRTMTDIVNSVQRVSDIIGEITAAASEQSGGIGLVNNSVTQLDQMTQQNAALVEESAAAAESLKEQAQRLAESVQLFKLQPAR